MKIYANWSHHGAVGSTIALLVVLMLQDARSEPTVAVQVPQVSCEDVRLHCSYDSGCNTAMKHYFLVCDKLLDANAEKCPLPCLYALAALTTTRHGHRMLDCSCRDSFCEMMKSRVEVCRPYVIKLTNESTVPPCDFARLVCQVDPECITAYSYHTTYCRRMHQNMPCSSRCLNSLGILERQEKARRLTRCRCMGDEALECLLHKERMLRLCFNEDGGGGGGGFLANAAADHDDDDDDDETDGHPNNRKKHKLKGFGTDPDRKDVEQMLADPDYVPDLERRRDVMRELMDDGTDSASAVRRGSWSAAVLCAAAAVALLVTRYG